MLEKLLPGVSTRVHIQGWSPSIEEWPSGCVSVLGPLSLTSFRLALHMLWPATGDIGPQLFASWLCHGTCFLSPQDFLWLQRCEKHQAPPAVHSWVHWKYRKVTVLRGKPLKRSLVKSSPFTPRFLPSWAVWRSCSPVDRQLVTLDTKWWPVGKASLRWFSLVQCLTPHFLFLLVSWKCTP